MRSGNRTNVLLVEILIVIFFFMIGSVILMQVFEKSHNQSEKAEAEMKALSEAQSIADRLYQAEDVEEELAALGFSKSEKSGIQSEESSESASESGLSDGTAGNSSDAAVIWEKTDGDIILRASFNSETMDSGMLRRGSVTAIFKGEELFSLPCTRYKEEG